MVDLTGLTAWKIKRRFGIVYGEKLIEAALKDGVSDIDGLILHCENSIADGRRRSLKAANGYKREQFGGKA